MSPTSPIHGSEKPEQVIAIIVTMSIIGQYLFNIVRNLAENGYG
jgi:hypothetical protein